MFSFVKINNEEVMSWENDYYYDGNNWMSVKEYNEMMELIEEDIRDWEQSQTGSYDE